MVSADFSSFSLATFSRVACQRALAALRPSSLRSRAVNPFWRAFPPAAANSFKVMYNVNIPHSVIREYQSSGHYKKNVLAVILARSGTLPKRRNTQKG